LIIVAEKVAHRLTKNSMIADWEERWNCRIDVKIESTFMQEYYEVLSLPSKN